MSQKDINSHSTIEQIYNRSGLKVRKGSGHKMEIVIPVVQEYLRPDPERIFPSWHRRAGEYGAPKLFVQSHLRWFIWEIEQYINETVRQRGRDGNEVMGERPRSRNDHLMTAMIYLLQERLAWYPAEPTLDSDDEEDMSSVLSVDPLTGY
jgi:hypothetical protein